MTLFWRDICDGAAAVGGLLDVGSSPLIYTFPDAHLAAFVAEAVGNTFGR